MRTVEAITAPKLHRCDQCERTFATSGGLKMHKESKHPADKIACPTCGKLCAGPSGLKLHMGAKGCGEFPDDIESYAKNYKKPVRDGDDFDVLDDGDDFDVLDDGDYLERDK